MALRWLVAPTSPTHISSVDDVARASVVKVIPRVLRAVTVHPVKFQIAIGNLCMVLRRDESLVLIRANDGALPRLDSHELVPTSR